MKISTPKSLLAIVTIAFLYTAPLSEAALYDYNTAEQWDDFYRPGAAIWSRATSGGIADTGWAVLASGNSTVPGFQLLNQKFSSDVDSFTLGVSFQWQSHAEHGVSTSGPNAALLLGIGRSGNNENFVPRFSGSDIGVESANMIAIGIGLTGTANVVRGTGGTLVNQERAFFNSGSSNTALVQGNWYAMEVVFEKGLIADSFDVTMNLYNSDNSGNRGGLLLSYTVNRANAALMDEEVNVFVGGFSQRYANISGVDNFYVQIPEPSLAGWMALVLLGLGCAKRLKRS